MLSKCNVVPADYTLQYTHLKTFLSGEFIFWRASEQHPDTYLLTVWLLIKLGYGPDEFLTDEEPIKKNMNYSSTFVPK